MPYAHGEDVQGSVSVDLDPDDGEGPHVYQVNYWIGVRTPESGAGINADCFCTDPLGAEATNNIGNLDGSSAGSAQGVFSFAYPGVARDATAVFHFDIGVFSPGGTLRYDYFISANQIALLDP